MIWKTSIVQISERNFSARFTPIFHWNKKINKKLTLDRPAKGSKKAAGEFCRGGGLVWYGLTILGHSTAFYERF